VAAETKNQMLMDFDPVKLMLRVNTIGEQLEALSNRVKEDREKEERVMESLAEELRILRRDRALRDGAMWASGKFWAILLGACSAVGTIARLL